MEVERTLPLDSRARHMLHDAKLNAREEVLAECG